MMKDQVPGFDSGLIFPSKTGGYRYSSLLKKPFAQICAAAGINKELSTKVFRRTANRLMRRANVDEAVKLAVIGHAGREVNRRYDAIEPSEAHQALSLVRKLAPLRAEKSDE